MSNKAELPDWALYNQEPALRRVVVGRRIVRQPRVWISGPLMKIEGTETVEEVFDHHWMFADYQRVEDLPEDWPTEPLPWWHWRRLLGAKRQWAASRVITRRVRLVFLHAEAHVRFMVSQPGEDSA